MPEPELVHRPDRRPAHHRGLAGGLQHGAATQLAGVSDPGGIRSPSSSAPVAYGSHRAAARPGPSFIGVRKPPGSYIMTGPRTGGRSMSFLYSYGYDYSSRFVHPMAGDGQDCIAQVIGQQRAFSGEQIAVLHNSILVQTMLTQEGLNQSRLHWMAI